MHAGLGGQQTDLLAGYIGCVGDQEVDTAPECGGQRLVEVTFVCVAAGGREIAAGAPYRGWVDVDGVQLDLTQFGGQRCAHRARAAAQVDNDDPGTGRACGGAGYLAGGSRRAGGGGGAAGEGGGAADEELGAPAWHEDARADGYPQATEIRPAHDLFQREAGGSPVHHGGDVGRGPRGGDDQLRLVLGEHAPGRPQPADEDRKLLWGQGNWHERLSGSGGRSPGHLRRLDGTVTR